MDGLSSACVVVALIFVIFGAWIIHEIKIRR